MKGTLLPCKDKVWLSLAFVGCFFFFKWLLSFESCVGWMPSHRVLSRCHSLGGEMFATHTQKKKKQWCLSQTPIRVRGFFPERFRHKETMLWMAVQAEHFHRFTRVHLLKMCTNWRPTEYYVWGVLPQFWQILLPPTQFNMPRLEMCSV